MLRRGSRHRHDPAAHLSDQPPAEGWWRAADGNWYPPPSPPPPPLAPPPPVYGGYGQLMPSMPLQPPSNGAATAGFVCGLVGFIICLIPFGVFVGGIVAVIGIVFGFIGRGRARELGTSSGMATAGVVLGIVGLIVGVLWLFALGSIFSRVRNNIEIHDGDFIVNPQTCRASKFGTLDASGTITNTTDFDKVLVQVHVTVVDSRGVIVGSGEDFVSSVDAHSTYAYFVTVGLDDPSVSEPHCDVAIG